jgi:hypothetical protein
MLSNKATASEVEKKLRQCSDILNESIRRVMETCPDEEFKAYRRVVAQIMGSMYLDVMQPIHRQYPDLEPQDLREPDDRCDRDED